MDFGTLIKRIRIDNSLTQQEFADLIHVSRQSVSKWENNQIIPNLDNVNEICKQFNVPIEEFFNSNIKMNIYSEIKPNFLFSIRLSVIIVVAILSWFYPRMVIMNYLLFIVIYKKRNNLKELFLISVIICIFYLITFFLYPDLYANAFKLQWDACYF